MNLKTHKFQITGLTPLLQNSSAAFVLATPTTVKTNKKPTREEEAEAKAWKDEKGFFHPSQAFRSALLLSLGGKKVGKRSARSAFMAAVFCSEEKFYLLDPDTGKPIKGYTLDTRMATTKMKTAIANTRPRFETWGGILRLEVDEDMIPDIALVEQALNDSGLYPGVGSFRICNGGTFGRFMAKRL
jgi:hypothetical protein